jgi:hypothetical protein
MPDLKVLFMSGYPAEVTKGKYLLHQDQWLLSKPFKRAQLAQALHAKLG